MTDKLAILETENADLRERIAYLESCLLGSDKVSYAILGLTGSEERVFAALMTRDVMTKEALLTLSYADKLDADLPSLKIIDVFICKIRKKLRAFEVDITTVWGRGYSIDPATKQRIRDLVSRAGGDHQVRAA